MGKLTFICAMVFCVYGIHTWGMTEFIVLAVVTLLFLALIGVG